MNNIHNIDVDLVCIALVCPFAPTGNDLEYIEQVRDSCKPLHSSAAILNILIR